MQNTKTYAALQHIFEFSSPIRKTEVMKRYFRGVIPRQTTAEALETSMADIQQGQEVLPVASL